MTPSRAHFAPLLLSRQRVRYYSSHENRRAKGCERQGTSVLRGVACWWARHALLAAKPHSHTEATADHRGRRNDVARDDCTAPASDPTAQHLGGHARGTSAGRAEGAA